MMESLSEKKKKRKDVRREMQRVREQEEIALKKRTLKIESEDRARKLKQDLERNIESLQLSQQIEEFFMRQEERIEVNVGLLSNIADNLMPL